MGSGPRSHTAAPLEVRAYRTPGMEATTRGRADSPRPVAGRTTTPRRMAVTMASRVRGVILLVRSSRVPSRSRAASRIGSVFIEPPCPARIFSTASATPSSLLEAVMKRAAAFTSGKALAMATPSPAALTMAVSLPPSPQAIRALAGRPSCSARASRPAPLSTPAALISMFRGRLDTTSTPRAATSAQARRRSSSSRKKMVSFSMPRSWTR